MRKKKSILLSFLTGILTLVKPGLSILTVGLNLSGLLDAVWFGFKTLGKLYWNWGQNSCSQFQLVILQCYENVECAFLSKVWECIFKCYIKSCK
jgi:hypothetical protein